MRIEGIDTSYAYRNIPDRRYDIAFLTHARRYLSAVEEQHILNTYSVHSRYDKGDVLIMAARHGYKNTIDQLLRYPLNTRDVRLAFRIAAQKGHTYIVKELHMHKRWQLNSRDYAFAFRKAAACGSVTTVKYVLESNRFAIKREDFNLAFVYAAERGNYEVVDTLLSQPMWRYTLPDATLGKAFRRAAAAGHAPVIRRILREPGAWVRLSGNNIREAWRRARWYGRHEVLEILRTNPHTRYYTT